MDLKSAVRKVNSNPSLMVMTLVGLVGVSAPVMAQQSPGSRALPPNRPPAPAAVPASPVPNNNVPSNPVPNAPASSNNGGAALRVDEGYLLGAGDKVKLDIFGVPEYSGEYQVLADGSINLPLAGGVTVQGLTLKQASNLLAARYKEWLTRPVVTISLITARPLYVAMSGEVTRPGTYATSLTEGGIPTLTTMVQRAGGIKPSADLKQVEIQRRRPGQSGGMQTIRVNLAQLLRGDLSQDIQLRDGDSVIIPASAAMNFAESNQLANSSFAANADRPINVIVAGAVNRPGSHSIQGENVPQANQNQNNTGQPNVAAKVKAPTVSRALQIAGGLRPEASIRNVQVKRMNGNGTEQTIKLDLMAMLRDGNALQDIQLQEGDRIVVGTATNVSPEEAAFIARSTFAPDAIAVNVVGEVEKPGVIQVPATTTLNQAILAAGGFNRRAKKREVQFVRLLPNGTVERRNVGVDFARGIDSKNNPQLQAYDTIVVGKSGLASFSDGIGAILAPFGSLLGIRGFFR